MKCRKCGEAFRVGIIVGGEWKCPACGTTEIVRVYAAPAWAYKSTTEAEVAS